MDNRWFEGPEFLTKPESEKDVKRMDFSVQNEDPELRPEITTHATQLRVRRFLTQHMADLPSERTETPPPFTNVGFDVFGPWTIHTRRTRGGIANSKRWGLIFTCLNSRAIHIEVLEAMDSNSLTCALRRFLSIRGPVSKLRYDCGTNFIGGKSELDEASKDAELANIKRWVTEQDYEWLFNPPHVTLWGSVGTTDWDPGCYDA